jgi:signal transduction histidine kinase
MLVTLLAASVYIVVRNDEPAWSVVPIGLAWCSAVAMTVPVVFIGELIRRPMVEDIARYLPPDFDAPVRSWRLGTRALAPLPIVTLFSALTVGAFANVDASGPVRLTLALGVALGTLAAASLTFAAVTRSVLKPMDYLLAATRRVRSGDLDTPVPLVTADDLGELTHDFNEMLEGLRERGILREHNVELIEELRASRARIVASSDEARRRVERDLHDGAQQHFVLLNLKLGLLDQKLDDDPAAAKQLTAELRSDLRRALEDLRDLAHGIYPAALENDGLPAALSEAAERAGIQTTVDCDSTGRFRPELEAAVYFCCLEALQNAAKYAGENARARVSLVQGNGELRFEVADDGVGFDSEAVGASAGLQNMTDRIGALGGELLVESAPGKGTRVSGVVPVSSEPA